MLRIEGMNPTGEGLLKNIQEAILGCGHAFEFHSPLEGESKS